jgi:hypothetical protein
MFTGQDMYTDTVWYRMFRGQDMYTDTVWYHIFRGQDLKRIEDRLDVCRQRNSTA